MTRKKLSENEAEFIKGSGKAASKPATEKPAEPTKEDTLSKPAEPTKEDALSKLFEPSLPAPKDPTIRFTADLPVGLHRRLNLAAVKSGKKKVELLREILETVLPTEQ